MELLSLLVGMVVVALVVIRPAPPTQVIYIPMEAAAPQGGMGCLPVIFGVGLVLLTLLVLGSAPS